MRARRERKKDLIWNPRGKYNGRGYDHRHAFSWKHLKFWKTEYWKLIKDYLEERREAGYYVLPSMNKSTIFRSLVMTPFDRVKIVILGQDPYYTKGIADGLAFSVLPNIKEVPPSTTKGSFRHSHYQGEGRATKIPGSLSNIFNEYTEDTGYPYPRTGDLSGWARNGILMANILWTVEEGRPRSHYKIRDKYAWQELTAEIIEQLSLRKDRLVFILWGKVAQEWKYMIDQEKHLVLEGPHPSPRNFTTRGVKFAGGKYFTKACEYLNIDKRIWRLP